MNDRIYWIWLSLSCTIDTITFPKLMETFKDAKEVYDADDYAITKCLGPKMSDRASLNNKDLERAESIYEFCQKHKVGILTFGDSNYPKLLKKISSPPVVLYYRGTLPNFDNQFCVGTVGTRSLSEYGRKNAFKISYDLATGGATVVSGMALGIDGVATAGAIAAGKPTVAILGCGIDVCYPPQHLKLAREIVKDGCIMTEYPPSTPPARFNFPKRNRIISGLCSATVVFEGRENSGALITARYAKEQGREVFVLPGNVGSPGSEIANLLLKDGAKACTRAEDVLSLFEKEFPTVINQFMLRDRCPVDTLYTLRQLEVVANCPTDDIYIPVKQRKRPERTAVYDKININPHSQDADNGAATDNTSVSQVKQAEVLVKSTENPSIFSADALKIYKKIPINGSCEIESLVDDKIGLREVMKYLLNLEMGKFVTLLPGGNVARKTK